MSKIYLFNCDNTDHDHGGKCEDVRPVAMLPEFNTDPESKEIETADWCEACRKRDFQLVDYLPAVCPLCGETMDYKTMFETHTYICPACSFVGLEFQTPKDAENVARYLREEWEAR